MEANQQGAMNVTGPSGFCVQTQKEPPAESGSSRFNMVQWLLGSRIPTSGRGPWGIHPGGDDPMDPENHWLVEENTLPGGPGQSGSM